MLSIWIADGEKRELAALETSARDNAAHLSEETLDCVAVLDLLPLRQKLQQAGAPDLACVDLGLVDSLSFSQNLRSSSRELFLVVVAPPELSPMQYLRPDILAGGLLLRPFTGQQAAAVLQGALRFCLQQREQTPDACFWVINRNGRESVRYSDILYFEARGKRICLITPAREYQFTDTMDHLAQTLPERFVRCHRSFIVRRDCIDRIQLSANLLYLESGEAIPLSRSYKVVLKGLAR